MINLTQIHFPAQESGVQPEFKQAPANKTNQKNKTRIRNLYEN
jgi:hypothetical protein